MDNPMSITFEKISPFLNGEMIDKLKSISFGLKICHDIISRIIKYNKFMFTDKCNNVLYDPFELRNKFSHFEKMDVIGFPIICFPIYDEKYDEIFTLIEYYSNLAFANGSTKEEINEFFSPLGRKILENYGVETLDELNNYKNILIKNSI